MTKYTFDMTDGEFDAAMSDKGTREIKNLLESAIENEEYEMAGHLKKELDKRKKYVADVLRQASTSCR